MTGNDSVNINGIGHFPIPCMVRVQMVARIEFSTQALQSPRIAQHCVEVDYGNEDAGAPDPVIQPHAQCRFLRVAMPGKRRWPPRCRAAPAGARGHPASVDPHPASIHCHR